ncbi:ESPR domain-containing protein [Oxalobacter formigenes]|uniref:ESPR domain-containing protein n=1 Tax=Oxalobacter formigenes TaxID=847 RepID=UPI0022B06FA1|nr:ESPR domain-containing protein [Oxalobacter formigenes]WAW02104.1 ESPR domain-containing protein [Oxalobacter formigenes]WAW08321.1 ESPR domain-containing protein [Oxalobacter formigenes]
MNQVFRVIWSDVRGTYIVCDENRLTRGKSKSLKCVLLIVAVAAMMGNVSAVMAENPSLPEGSVVINQGDTQTYTGESGNPLAGKTMLVAPEKNANGNYKGVRGETSR